MRPLPRSARVDPQDPASSCARSPPGLATAPPSGFAYYFILGSIGFFFLFIFVAAGIGYLVGEAVSRASGRFHGLQTAVMAAVATLVGPSCCLRCHGAFLSYGVNWNTVVFALSARGIINWVVMVFAAYLAWNRNR